jgi:hypothetical protein
VLGVVFAVNVSAQNTAGRGGGAGKLLIADDTLMLEQQRRNSRLTALQRREIESAMRSLAASLNGTWELVERTVSNNETKGRTILVPNAGQMIFNLKPNGMIADGDFFIIEEGLGNLAVSDGLPNGEPYILSSYNQVQFQGSFENEGTIGRPGMSFAPQQNRIVISEQMTGEIQGSYGMFRSPTAFRQQSRDLAQYVMRGTGNKTTFVSRGKVPAPSGTRSEGADTWDIIKVSNDVMLLGISEKGLLDIWRKTSNNVQIEGQPLGRYWESLKRSQRLLKPTFRAQQ